MGSEIILKPMQFCNLTEVVVKSYDTEETLKEKVELASILGTIQATYTYFPYLRKAWTDNTEEERLLGVSLTGCMDNPITVPLRETEMSIIQEELKQIVIETNKKYARKLNIPQSVATTCNKPSGTVSQLVDSASGIHARFAKFYVRTVRGDNKDPLTEFMKDMGIPWEPAFGKEEQTTVFSFPMKSPEGSVLRDDMSAIRQLEVWLIYQRSWCEHKPSVTINVKDDEWMDVGAFVYNHFDEMSGVSFLPYDGGSYKQAPYQEIGEKEYNERLANMPKNIDWTLLSNYEMEDNTTGSQTMACSGSSCEIVDIT